LSIGKKLTLQLFLLNVDQTLVLKLHVCMAKQTGKPPSSDETASPILHSLLATNSQILNYFLSCKYFCTGIYDSLWYHWVQF